MIWTLMEWLLIFTMQTSSDYLPKIHYFLQLNKAML